MADATFAVSSFLGGEISLLAQGRFDRPDYRISLKVCLNAFPLEIGPWTRRPGTRHAGHTRGGMPARVIKFDFEQAIPYTLEFTDGKLRFRNGAALVATNDPQIVLSISAANPAVVQTAGAHGWSTAETVFFSFLHQSELELQNRQAVITVIDATHFSIADALTGVGIDGSAITFLNQLSPSAIVSRVREVTTSYVAGAWASIRAVQAETTDILLHPTIAPQALTVTSLPNSVYSANFALAAVLFSDGPYLDPFTNGVQASPSGLSGNVTLTLSFPAYSSAVAYAAGAFVTTGSVNYISLLDQNVGNAPAGGAPWWAPTSAGAAINGGQGFLGTDTGRLVRLFSEPDFWAAGTTYAKGNVVAYNKSNTPGIGPYYTSLVGSNTGNTPGLDITNWTVTPQAAIWTWGKITGLSNIIDRALAGSASIGNMTSGGGLAAAFDGVISQVAASAAESLTSGGATAAGTVITLSSFVGKNYAGAADQKIAEAVVYPSSDQGLAFGSYLVAAGLPGPPVTVPFTAVITLNLRGKASAPANAADGILLGSVAGIANSTAPVTIFCTDQVTSWKYVWVEQITTAQIGGVFAATSYSLTNAIGELALFNPPGTGTAAGVTVEILGPALLYSTPIRVWRLGAYSNTTGWPTCGTYHEGRLWLGGAIANRFDACVSNGILGAAVNFAPTDQYGALSASSAITETLNSDGVNPMYWMKPDLQGVVIGTQNGEWLVQAPTTGPIAPNNIVARRVTKHGSANIEPVRAEHANIFVKRYARKLLEYFADAYSGKFSAPNLADKAQSMVRAGIAELAYTEAVTPIVWVRDTLGALFGITYKRTKLSTSEGPDYAAWHRHTLGSGRVVESFCAGPSVGGDLDTLTMVTNDPATGIRHVELLTDTMDEETALQDAWFVDDAVPAASTNTTDIATPGAPYGALRINGLWHLNGEVVQVFAGGLDCGLQENGSFQDFFVTAGSCFVPYGDGISWGSGAGRFTAALANSVDVQIVVGFTYRSDGQIVRPISMADSGARNGPGFAKISRNHRFGLQLVNTRGISVGGDLSGTLYSAPLKLADGVTDIDALSTFTGICADTLQDDYGYASTLCWRVSRPYPASVVAVGTNLLTQDQ